MTFGSRIGQFFKGAAQRIGSFDVHGALNRIGAIASAAHKVGSLINAVTGNGLSMASEAYLGKKATSAIGGATSYMAKAYDTSLMMKAGMKAEPSSGTSSYGGGATSTGMPSGSNVIWTGGKRAQ